MATLISPGVSVKVTDESAYISGRPTSLPIIFVATESEKFQSDGVTPALGTYEHGVLRTVTSLRQSLELFGVPKYYASVDGKQHHGDARNEYGLDALNKFLEVGNRAYVVRANINNNDDPQAIQAIWDTKIQVAGQILNDLIEDYLTEYNSANNLYPADINDPIKPYKQTVNEDELNILVMEALTSVFEFYSFSSDLFEVSFMEDHTMVRAGWHDVKFDTSGGFLTLNDVTGLDAGVTYAASVTIENDTFTLSYDGEDVSTFGDLITAIQADIGGAGSVDMFAGYIRITSTLQAITSSVLIVDGMSGVASLFANLNLFKRLGEPVGGNDADMPLVVYDDDMTLVIGQYNGLKSLIAEWVDGAVVADEFTADEAEGLLILAGAEFDSTREFRNETSLGSNDAEKRAKIVQQLQAVINDPTSNIRAEHLEYNIAICAGYPECSDELLRLSADMFQEVFVIGETPFDKPPSGPNGIDTWAASIKRSTDHKIAYYYGHGISSNFDGVDILTTAGATALRAFAFNDSEAELWFAPAGTARGRCEHLSSVGYVSGTLGGPTTFTEDYLDNGMRDTLYEFPKNVNPVTFIPGRGILILGQKTTNPITSALDRINVSRMVMYIKRELRKGLFAYLFEPNDDITRKQVKFAVDNFLIDLVSRRGLYDFATIVDFSNNTPERIDRNELWVDIALKPVKAIEFVHVNIAIVRTGADIGSGRNIIVGA